VDRPRLLLVSGVSELEWQIKPHLEQWADVVSFDPPGVGKSSGDWSIEAAAARALELVGERNWAEFVLVAEAWGSWYVPSIIRKRHSALRGLALGHAALSARMTGDRAVRHAAVWDALSDLVAQGQARFARFAIPQFTRDGIDEKLAAEIIERVPMATFEAILEAGKEVEYDLEDLLRALNLPLLFAQHRDCLLYSDEGYEDAVAAFPEARTCATEKTCSADPVFANALRGFCEEIYT
jgi:pimeloyl-ACP methyl ester carboxylesterase